MMSSLAENWRRAGVEPGDILLVHSSMSRTLNEHNATPEQAVASFLEAVAPGGTVLFPLFNFGFAEGEPFDIRSTPSQMGALTEAARLHPDSLRSGHPIYSFAIIGPQAERFAVDNKSGYGPNSPFALLRELEGKIGVIDLDDQNSMTFYHHVEEMHAVDYRFHKEFTGPYTDQEGVTSERTYSLFVRDLEKGVLTDVNRMGERLWQLELYRGFRPHQGPGLRTIGANELYRAVSEIIEAGRAREFLYSIDEEKS